MTGTTEERRLEALRSFEILDSPEEEEYSNITALAAGIMGVPEAAITFIDEDRQFVKSSVLAGGPLTTTLDVSFCRHMVATHQPLIVEDASRHDIFRTYSNVVEDPHLRFYAGVPLEAPEGEFLGALCVVDYKARSITTEQLKVLRMLANQVEDQLELRRSSRLLKSALDEAMEARKARDTFFASISHDIRTPAAAIVGAAELLSRSDHDEATGRLVRGIRANGNTLVLLLNNLLDLAKVEAGKFEVVNSVFDLMALCGEVMDNQAGLASPKGVSLVCDYASDLGHTFHGDPLRIRQVLANLVSNAVKFTRQGSVRLEVARDGNDVRFEVVDTGIGIPADRLDKVFQEYEQADGNTAAGYGGTGLGLAIVSKLVDLMGGRIGIESTVGEGSTFSVWLPLQPAEFQGSEQVNARLRALIVDDNEVSLLLLESLLEDVGIESDQASTGKEARRALRETQYDFIFLDERLDDARGTELAREIRADASVRQGTIISISASTDEEERRKFLAAGMDGFLPKPFSPAELEALVRARAS